PVGRLGDFRGVLGGTEVRGQDERFEHKVPLGQLVLGEATSRRIPLIIAVVVSVVGQSFDAFDEQIVDQTFSRAAQFALPALVLLMAILGVLLVAAVAAIGVARNFGITARRSETRIEIEAGLFERRQVSIPVGRIQAVRIEASWLRRLLGLVAIEVDTAGLERGGQQSGHMAASKAMVPVARAVDVSRLFHGLLPEAEVFPETQGLATRALRFYILVPTVLMTMAAFAAVGPASWFLYRPALPWATGVVVLVATITISVRVLQWRAAGIGTDDVAVAIRSGVLGVKRVRLTRSRIQSLDIRQNPFQRRAKLATLRTISVSGSSSASYGVSHLDEAEALRIMRWYEDGLVTR
ncbi:MAG: PH domain-containing protein, partial [Actinomycetota bacterium]|nr:PH domain-containing protein [Actinomycetota bacterium]